MSRHRLTSLAALLLMAGLACAVWVHRIHIDQPNENSNLLNSDTYRYFYPTFQYIHEELRSGHLPLWNPYQMAGQPFLALHIPALLYPPNLVLLTLFPAGQAIGAVVMLHLFLAGLFTWLFTGCLSLGFFPRLATSLTFMLSSALLMGVYMMPFLTTPVWLPAILWALTRLAQEPRLRWALALAVFIVLSFLGGHAQATLYTVQVASLYGVFALLFVCRDNAARLRVVGLALVGGVVAFGLAAPQLLPSLELTAQAVRGYDGVSLRQAGNPALLRWSTIHGLLRSVTDMQLHPGLAPTKWLATFPHAALPLMLLGIFLRGNRRYYFFFLALTLLLWSFVQGVWSPVFRFYYELPGGNLFRAPMRAAFLYIFAGSVLMGMGFEALLRGLQRLPGSSGRIVPAVFGAAIALGIGIDDYHRTRLEVGHPSLKGEIQGAPDRLLEIVRARSPYDRSFVQGVNFYSPKLLFKFGMMNRAFAVPDYEPSMPGVYGQFFDTPEEPPWHGRLKVVSDNPSHYLVTPALLDLMSVRYYVAARGLGPSLEALGEKVGGAIEAHGDFHLIRRPQALPRAYAVRYARVERDLEATKEQVHSPFFDGRVQAIVTDDDPSDEGSVRLPFATMETAAPAGDRVEIVRFESERVELRARCLEACLAVLTDLHYPGWVASVDGEPAPIHRVNLLFRGVQLTPGEHRIVYRFEPASFRIGVALFATTIVGLGGYGLFWRKTTARERQDAGNESTA